MKKFIISVFCFLGLSASAQTIQLPQPNLNSSSKSLFEVLKQRKSIRTFSNKEVDDATLSTILWSACGINRPEEKKITAPSAINAQDIIVYVCRADGAYLYHPEDNSLEKVSELDLRKAVAGNQTFVCDAPISLVLVSDAAKFNIRNEDIKEKLGTMDVGYVSENICLACSALGLATVPRMGMDRDVLKKELHLAESQSLLLNNPIGFPK